ncbi:MAG: hypothetical protein ACRCSF_00715, partial [Mycobacteriaceae bacterium]
SCIELVTVASKTQNNVTAPIVLITVSFLFMCYATWPYIPPTGPSKVMWYLGLLVLPIVSLAIKYFSRYEGVRFLSVFLLCGVGLFQLFHLYILYLVLANFGEYWESEGTIQMIVGSTLGVGSSILLFLAALKVLMLDDK